MSVTYTSAAERAFQRARTSDRRVGWPDALLAAASAVALFTIALAYAGVTSRLMTEGVAPAVNLNAVADAHTLEPIVATVFADPSERRSATADILRFVLNEREEGRRLPNVGALAQVRKTRTESTAATTPLLTSSQLAQLKPSFAVRTTDEFRSAVLLFALLYVGGFQAVALFWRLRGARHDRLLLVVAHVLTAIGFAALLARPDPLRDSLLVGRYTEGILIGLALMAAVSAIGFRTVADLELSFVPLVAALTLSVLLLLFGSGPGSSAAKVNLGPIQPIEAIRLLLALFLAGYFARRWELLRGVRETSIRNRAIPGWLNLPRLEYVLPVAAGVGVALFFFFLQKDLGPALFTCCVFLAVYAIARGRAELAIGGLAALFVGFYAGYVLQLSPTLAGRIGMWRSPWDNTVAGGDQIAHALWAMSSGALSGTGLGLGDTRYLPAGHTDLILAAIGEEQGALGLGVVAALYALLTWRGIRAAHLARNDYGFFLAATMTLFLIVPVFIMAAGVIGAAPLTGVVTPFLSYGGSAMVTNFVALGVLAAVQPAARRDLDAPFRTQVRWLTGVLGAAAVILVALYTNVQVVHADAFLVKPHLGIQADGGRRYAYNPRILDIVRQLPRGTVFDGSGRPLATSDADVIAKAREPFKRLGIAVDDACPTPGERCYPLSGRAFHLLGDIRTRLNWSATNSSYVERDAENLLRGFDDHPAIVNNALRRDYSAIVPLLRRDEDAVAAFLARSRDVHLTIDAELQLKAASIVASYAKRSSGRAAAIVLDAGTGDVLASVSYPWPSMWPVSSTAEDRLDADLLDRARYGLYPPGSTFKLVTAAAALREHDKLESLTFACSRLTDGRVGAKIAGWGRPIRDDVLDTHPHGTIDLHDGLVRSCNAYFAQLAVALGPQPLTAAAAQLGITLTKNEGGSGRLRDTLPQIGYGQGEVVTTPLRMARVAAAIAADGKLRQVQWITGSKPSAPEAFLDSTSARLLGRYMRDAVLTGTGRTLKDHRWPIAGKTGTAEVSGKPSHSWFVGFAPWGASTRRIAFAVVIENAGYGSANAAPAAGEIVSAAAAAGLLEQ